MLPSIYLTWLPLHLLIYLSTLSCSLPTPTSPPTYLPPSYLTPYLDLSAFSPSRPRRSFRRILPFPSFLPPFKHPPCRTRWSIFLVPETKSPAKLFNDLTIVFNFCLRLARFAIRNNLALPNKKVSKKKKSKKLNPSHFCLSALRSAVGRHCVHFLYFLLIKDHRLFPISPASASASLPLRVWNPGSISSSAGRTLSNQHTYRCVANLYTI